MQIYDFVFYRLLGPDGSTCWGSDGLEEGDVLGSKVRAELNFKEDLRMVVSGSWLRVTLTSGFA